MAHVTTAPYTPVRLVESIRSAWEGYKVSRKLYADYRATVNELQKLDDRELVDLGISRYDIEEISRKHVYGI